MLGPYRVQAVLRWGESRSESSTASPTVSPVMEVLDSRGKLVYAIGVDPGLMARDAELGIAVLRERTRRALERLNAAGTECSDVAGDLAHWRQMPSRP